MKHEVTIISDDLRFELGSKVSLCGIYDEAIIFRSLPTRLLKLAFYQRWTDIEDLRKVALVIRGSAMGVAEFRVDAKPVKREGKQATQARITLAVGPIDILSEGSIQFQTFLNDAPEPQHVYELVVRVDPALKVLET